jgi:threonine aldolase
MRQVGVLAAAGIYALLHNVDRLAQDHENAQRLARGLAEIPGIEILPQDVETNILVVRVVHERLTSVQLVEVLRTYGVLVVPFGRGLVRAVTHMDVAPEDIDPALDAFRRALR